MEGVVTCQALATIPKALMPIFITVNLQALCLLFPVYIHHKQLKLFLSLPFYFTSVVPINLTGIFSLYKALGLGQDPQRGNY